MDAYFSIMQADGYPTMPAGSCLEIRNKGFKPVGDD
jgi:hypothetical protein